MIALGIWLIGFLVALVFVPRMARFICDGKGVEFPHLRGEHESFGLALVAAMIWPVLLACFSFKYLVEYSFGTRQLPRRPRARGTQRFVQGEIWEQKNTQVDVRAEVRARLVVVGVSIDGEVILQGLNDDGEHNLVLLRAEELSDTYAPGESMKLAIA